jgi:alkyldihydroxyacetonephosphate synthase
VQDYRGVLFPGLAEGIQALRDLVQDGPRPTIACLLDARGTAAFAAQARGRHGLSGLADRAVESYLAHKGRVGGDNCILILGYDGEARSVHRWQRPATALCREYGGLPLGRAAGEAWKQERFAWPYLRDALVGGGLLVDTVEAVTPWSNLLRLYGGLTTVVGAAVRASGGGPGYVMTEVAHASAWGASLGVTFLGRRTAGQEIEQWQTVKQAAVEAVLSTGGVLCCGLGRESAAWLPDEVGSPERRALQALKQALDPAGIMNPGVLF